MKKLLALIAIFIPGLLAAGSWDWKVNSIVYPEDYLVLFREHNYVVRQQKASVHLEGISATDKIEAGLYPFGTYNFLSATPIDRVTVDRGEFSAADCTRGGVQSCYDWAALWNGNGKNGPLAEGRYTAALLLTSGYLTVDYAIGTFEVKDVHENAAAVVEFTKGNNISIAPSAGIKESENGTKLNIKFDKVPHDVKVYIVPKGNELKDYAVMLSVPEGYGTNGVVKSGNLNQGVIADAPYRWGEGHENFFPNYTGPSYLNKYDGEFFLKEGEYDMVVVYYYDGLDYFTSRYFHKTLSYTVSYDAGLTSAKSAEAEALNGELIGIYNAQGKKLGEMQKGLNVMKYKDAQGKPFSKKVFVK